jgi:hypothetical protein
MTAVTRLAAAPRKCPAAAAPALDRQGGRGLVNVRAAASAVVLAAMAALLPAACAQAGIIGYMTPAEPVTDARIAAIAARDLAR